jgi:hypothetical protein
MTNQRISSCATSKVPSGFVLSGLRCGYHLTPESHRSKQTTQSSLRGTELSANRPLQGSSSVPKKALTGPVLVMSALWRKWLSSCKKPTGQNTAEQRYRRLLSRK